MAPVVMPASPLRRRGLLRAMVGLGAVALPAALLGPVPAAAQPRWPPPPPPLRLEPPPGRPRPRMVWQPGHWIWNRRDYVWVPGRWIVARRGAWDHGHWEQRPRGPVWVPGGWR
ncbi:MAG: hypothetical protein EON47_03910 [Acetobacteraceae bacterium]|nr:MAG: hypothetical protein EON47_03910 [Acetobacteraceae bacterium]